MTAPTDLNTLDDWWNEGFDDFFDGGPLSLMLEIKDHASRGWWRKGWRAANAYRNALKEQTDER